MPSQAAVHEHWSSRFAFILAAIGSAVGLGNLWRFPYEAGENGGGAFILVYLVCAIAIGLPVLVSEYMIGRRGQKSAPASVALLARESNASPAWSGLAFAGMAGSFIILSFYSVIAGWVMSYVLLMGGDLFGNIANGGLGGIASPAFADETRQDVADKLTTLLGDPTRLILFHALFMAFTVYIVSRGIKGGIEAAVQILMPAFFVMLVVLVGYSVLSGGEGTSRALSYLFFDVDFSKVLDGDVMLSAVGQAFFSIGLGSALMITYGSYMTRDVNIPGVSGIIVAADTGVAILAGLAIFPIVFAVGLDPAAGPTLMFQSLPQAFQGMPFGSLFGLIFFILAFFAALTSSISLLEIVTAWTDEKIAGAHRRAVAAAVGVVTFIVGIGSALSFNVAAGFTPLDAIPLFAGATFFDVMDILSGKVLLPLSGFLVALFAGWAVTEDIARDELGFKSDNMFRLWRFLIRYICPAAVGVVLVWGAIISPFLKG